METLARSRCWVEVSRGRIAANYHAVRQAVAPLSQVICVVKANAYGHGTVEVSRTLEREGARWLAVTSVEEGALLRENGIGCRILVMAGVMPWEHGALREYALTPVLHSVDEIRSFPRERCAVHLKIDTGMDRLGTLAGAGEIARALEDCPHLELEGLMSHFASAPDFSTRQTEEQIAEFHRICAELTSLGVRPALRHFASTNAIAYPRRDAWLSFVRPGHALYGYVSPARGAAPAAVFRVKPALSWKTRIVVVKDIAAGARIGYGGSWVAHAPMRIAVLAAGYADGVLHRLSNKGHVIAGGKLARIVGTVSMDLTTIDVTQSPELKPGDEVTLLGQEGGVSLDAQQIGRVAGTISYNVLCSISHRVNRIYVD